MTTRIVLTDDTVVRITPLGNEQAGTDGIRRWLKHVQRAGAAGLTMRALRALHTGDGDLNALVRRWATRDRYVTLTNV